MSCRMDFFIIIASLIIHHHYQEVASPLADYPSSAPRLLLFISVHSCLHERLAHTRQIGCKTKHTISSITQVQTASTTIYPFKTYYDSAELQQNSISAMEDVLHENQTRFMGLRENLHLQENHYSFLLHLAIEIKFSFQRKRSFVSYNKRFPKIASELCVMFGTLSSKIRYSITSSRGPPSPFTNSHATG